jgi:hypothetical protein
VIDEAPSTPSARAMVIPVMRSSESRAYVDTVPFGSVIEVRLPCASYA